MAAYGKVAGGSWTDSTDYIRRLKELRQANPDAVRQIEQRASEIYQGYTEDEVYSKGGAAKTPGARYEDSRRDSMSRATEEALREYERMAAATDIGLGDYDPPELEIDLEDLAPEEEEEIVTGPLSDPQSQGLQGEIQGRQQVEDEVEDDFSNRRQQFLKTQGAGQDSVLAPDPNSLESQLLEQSTVTSAEPEAYTPRKPLLERFAPDLFGNLNRSAAGDVTGNIAEAVEPSKFSAGGLSREEYYQRSVDQAEGRAGRGMFGFGNDGQDDVDRARERSDRFRFYEEEPTEDESASAGVPRVSQNPPAPSASDSMRANAENTVGFGAATPPDAVEHARLVAYGKNRPESTIRPSRTAGMQDYNMQRVEQPEMPSAGAAGQGVGSQLREQGGNLMGRLAGLGSGIGGFVKDNPDLVLQGLQTVGELGGAYKRSRREEEAAKRMAEEARMGTAISALTRGRVNPSVAPQMPRTSAGEGMFDVMAGIGRGGQEFMAGDRQRTMESEDRAQLKADTLRAQGIEEDEIARQTARDKELMELEQYDAKTRRMGVTRENEDARSKAEKEAAKGAEKIELQKKESDYIAKQVDKMFTLFDEGGPTETGRWAWDASYGDAAELQQRFDSTRDSLIGYMNTLMKLGRMSDNDVKIILKALPNRDEGAGWNRGKVQGILENLEAMSGGNWSKKTFDETGSGYKGGSLMRSDLGFGGFGQFSDEDLSGGLTEEDIEDMSPQMQAALGDELERRGF